jgi:hypothetical protein
LRQLAELGHQEYSATVSHTRAHPSQCCKVGSSFRSRSKSFSRPTHCEYEWLRIFSHRACSERYVDSKTYEDAAFWSAAPRLESDWPGHWKHGWVYGFETLRMMVRRPIGIYKHLWDPMQIQAPCAVASPLNLIIFRLGGAPEAHEVLSKTPRIEFHFVVKLSCPMRFRSSLATNKELCSS